MSRLGLRVEQVISGNASPSPVQNVFLTRANRGLEELSAALNPGALSNAASASTDIEVLLSALNEPDALRFLAKDPLAEARLKGQMRRKELLQAEGGSLGPEEVGDMLGITRQAVDKRRKAGTLLAIEVGNRFLYPAWQIHENKTLPHLEEVLSALQEHDAWRKLSFLVNGNIRLDGRSPLAALRAGQTEEVLQAARSLGEHGAS